MLTNERQFYDIQWHYSIGTTTYIDFEIYVFPYIIRRVCNKEIINGMLLDYLKAPSMVGSMVAGEIHVIADNDIPIQ